jgi:hypothetical protein
MAIFSLHHSTVGRTTHAPRTASANARYITREEACTRVLGARMPTQREELFAWLDAQEQADRKNARVIDKVMVALPIELTHDQRAELVKEFCEGMTQGRAAWVAAIHDGPGDADNPHVHIIFRDRDFETGKRVMLLSEQGSTERLRGTWERDANLALERAGLDTRIDRRSLEEQGIKREPEIHVGSAAQELTKRGERPKSIPREVSRIIEGERTSVTIDYPSIDGGRTRIEENEERRSRNRALVTEPELDWTQRGGMVAQQRSAMAWVKTAHKEGLAHAQSDPPERKLRPESTNTKAQAQDERLAQFLRARSQAREPEEPDPGLEP